MGMSLDHDDVDTVAVATGAVASVELDAADATGAAGATGATAVGSAAPSAPPEPPVPPDGPLADLVDGFVAGLRGRLPALVEAADGRVLAAALGDLARLGRAVEAAVVAMADVVDRRERYTADGHRSVRAWLTASVRAPRLEALRQVETVRLLRECPRVGELLAAGRIGVAQVRLLARAHAHPRAGRFVVPVIDRLVGWAAFDEFEVFEAKLREFVRLVDADGANQSAEAAHRARFVRLATVGDRTYLSGAFANAQAAVIAAVLDAFSGAEYQADRDDARARCGDGSSEAQLARTPRQRRADALVALCEAAATAPVDGASGGVAVCVDVVIDAATFQRQLAELVDPLHLRDQPTPAGHATTGRVGVFGASVDGAVGAPTPGMRSLCQTTDGMPVAPVDAVVAALYGHVRRVVVGGDGMILDVGRRRRLFTGSVRDAAVIQGVLDRNGRCSHPGCARDVHCQVDHLREWRDGGVTAIGNAGIVCGHHNRFKSSGYTTRRDASGHWHTFRPDHTEIRAA